MTSKLVILLLIPLSLSLGLNAYLLTVNVSNNHVNASYSVSNFSQDFGFYTGTTIQHSDVYLIGTIYDGARTSYVPSSAVHTLTANHPIPFSVPDCSGIVACYWDNVGWATPSFTNDTIIDGSVQVNIWASSGSSCASINCGSAYGSSIVEFDANNNRIWNSTVDYRGQHGQILSATPAPLLMTLHVQNHKVSAGHRIVFLFGVGSSSNSYSANVYFGSQPRFSSASVPEVGTFFSVSQSLVFTEGSSNSYVNVYVTIQVSVGTDAGVYVRWRYPSLGYDENSNPKVIAYVTIAHTNKTGFDRCYPPSCSSPSDLSQMSLSANTQYIFELQTTEIQDKPFTTPKYPALTPLSLIFILASIPILVNLARKRTLISNSE